MTHEMDRFTLRITKELKDQLQANGKKMGLSLNSLVVQILWAWVEMKQENK
jgi:predicted HicB family RNase H-like nuclease